MNWKKFSEEKPKPESELVIADNQGVSLGLYEWFPGFEIWPEHVKPMNRISGGWIDLPLYWMYYEDFVKEILPK